MSDNQGDKPQIIIKWKFCHECGSIEFVNEKLIGQGYRECRDCGQEWWTDIDYTDVIKKYLNQRKSFNKKYGSLEAMESRMIEAENRVKELEDVLHKLKPLYDGRKNEFERMINEVLTPKQ